MFALLLFELADLMVPVWIGTVVGVVASSESTIEAEERNEDDGDAAVSDVIDGFDFGDEFAEKINEDCRGATSCRYESLTETRNETTNNTI